MKIGLLIIATNKYISFVNPLLESVKKYFMVGHEVTPFVFTNMKAPEGTVEIKIGHEPWPMPTLKRYHNFCSACEQLSDMDYVYYSDADMRFVAPVGDEILGDLVMTNHPGFYNKSRDDFPYERRGQSSACIPRGFGVNYFAGGFNGGKVCRFLQMSDTIIDMVDADERNGLVAEWHDESYMNRYCLDFAPDVILSPSYCYPESWDLPFEKKLLALDKNHEEVRGQIKEKRRFR
jgi:histo-blood group ABO system transferase